MCEICVALCPAKDYTESWIYILGERTQCCYLGFRVWLGVSGVPGLGYEISLTSLGFEV